MTVPERVKFIIKTASTDDLLDVWEMTTNRNDPNIPTIRGWLMDEFEKRFPDEFATWLSEDAPQDEDLRKYIGARRVRS